METKLNRLVIMLIVIGALMLSACGGAAPSAPLGSTTQASPPTAAPVKTTASVPAPSVVTQPPTTPTSAAPAAGKSNLPGWWPRELAMPLGTILTTDTQRTALWENPESNREAIRDFLVTEGNAAGYKVYALKDDIGHTLYFFKGSSAWTVNILQTTIAGNEVGSMHVKTAGAVSVEYDVPLEPNLQARRGEAFNLRGFLRGVPCSDCVYSLSINMDEYKGAGAYNSQAMRIVVEVLPGGVATREDYKGASCAVVIRDDQNGTFECKGAANVFDKTRQLDASGTWHLLLSASVAAARPTATEQPEPTSMAEATGVPAKTNRFKYQVNLGGAYVLAGSFEMQANDDACQFVAGFYGFIAAPPDAVIAGHKFAFIAYPANYSIVGAKPGTYALDKKNKSGVFVDDGEQAFSSDDASSGSISLQSDGSGRFTFKDFTDERISTNRESGTISWTCSR